MEKILETAQGRSREAAFSHVGEEDMVGSYRPNYLRCTSPASYLSSGDGWALDAEGRKEDADWVLRSDIEDDDWWRAWVTEGLVVP